MASPSRIAVDLVGNRPHLQLLNGNFRVAREDDPLVGRHSPRQRQLVPAPPVRPQIGRGNCGKPSDSLLSPRQKTSVSPVNSTLVVSRPATVASPVQGKSSRAKFGRLAIPENGGGLSSYQCLSTSSSTREQDDGQDMELQSLFPINVRAREHVEIKACLLAHTHRLDVDELHRIRGNNQVALNRFKMQRIISNGGAYSVDGSKHEEAKRKTTFLLRHFFALEDTLSPQDQLLCDVVDDWAVGDHATQDEISRLWKAINEHIEQSYLLRRKLVANSDPDEISVTIAMDCLKKLPERLPEYRRVLDVIVAVIDSGLYVNVSLPDSSRDDEEFPHERKILYFEAFRALQTIADTAPQSSTCRASLKYPWQDMDSGIPFRQRIEGFYNQLENEDDKKELFGVLLRGNLATLAASACEDVFKFYLETGDSERAGTFLSLLMQKINSTDITRLLAEISHSHLEVLQKFALDNVDCLVEEAPIASDPATEKKIPALFQRLVDQHPNEFAAILWRSPYLTAHIFQGSENLVARILEQNVYRISQVLTQRGEVLLPLLSHTFKENTAVLEEFLVNHPRGLADLLMNRSSSIAAVMKTKPYILADILQACNPTLTKVLASTPEIISSVIKTNPQALPQIVREDTTILAAVFATVPQCLGDTLEKHPEFLVDAAHRKPALVSRLFAEHPDLLLEPLEANPALFTTFLLYHRSVLPDFNDPNFDPTVYKLKTKILMETGVQTSNKLNQGRRKLRARDKLRTKCEELLEPLRAVPEKEINLAASSQSTQTDEEVLSDDALPVSDILNAIGRIYVAKIAADEHDDMMNRKRQSLADFVTEAYTVELGLKPLAKKKLLNLLIAAKQVGNAPEAMRVKWFRRFMNAIPGDRPLPQTALDFFLLALQHVIPGGHLAMRLDAASFSSCTVSQSTWKALVDDPLVSRLFDSKEQRLRILAFQCVSEPSRQDAGGTVARSSITMLPVLQLDDVLDMVMKVWMQYQLRVRDEWAAVFQDIVPDASGVAHFDAFSTMVRTKLPGLDNRSLMKIYNSCGEENEHGDFTLFSDDFTFTMSIMQEQHMLRQYTSSSSSTASSAQLLTPFTMPPVSGRRHEI